MRGIYGKAACLWGGDGAKCGGSFEDWLMVLGRREQAGAGMGGRESFEEWRNRILVETGQFIEWGLAHPEKVAKIPTQVVGAGAFTEKLKNAFWGMVFGDKNLPE